MQRPYFASLLLFVFTCPSPGLGQETAAEITDAFLSAIGDSNARTVLELINEDSGTEARTTADSLGGQLLLLDRESLGQFFSGFGLEAAPDEIEFWDTADFLEILLISTDFDSTWAEAEESEQGIWQIDIKNGVFLRMLRDLNLEQYQAP